MADAKKECYCRQRTRWLSKNPKKCINGLTWCATAGKACANGEKVTSVADYIKDIEKDCRQCTRGAGSNAPEPSINSFDCVADGIKADKSGTNGEIIRQDHNTINKLARIGYNSWVKNEHLDQSVLKDVNINLQAEISINNASMINKHKSLYTKRRLLLYDEKNDRIYRTVIMILKSILLISSIVLIKLLLKK